MKWETMLQELAKEQPEAAKIAAWIIKIRKTGQFSSHEALETVFGTDLANLILATEDDFDKMLTEE